MTSLISWLDASAAEANRMRELVRLFQMPESVDDLALGQFRDAISNSLFPGTSVLHVAVRYLLLVPWCYQSVGNIQDGEKLRAAGEQAERRLIRRFQELGVERFIGRLAGDRVAQLPSAAYWSALRTWGIVRADVERSAVGEAMADEVAYRHDGVPVEPVWHTGMPALPDGFPGQDDGGVELGREEAEWIRDRLLATVPGTLLAQLAANPRRVQRKSHAPWADPATSSATGEAAEWLAHAEAYSALQHGLDATYYFLVSNATRRTCGTAVDPEASTGATSGTNTDAAAADQDAAERATEHLDEWQSNEHLHQLLRTWDVNEFIGRATKTNPRIQPHSVAFLARARQELATGGHPAGNDDLLRMVREREMRAKGTNSRFVNQRRLRSWKTPDEVNPQTFRWLQVRTMMIDLREGLARA